MGEGSREEAAFVATRLVCGDCGHELTEEEVKVGVEASDLRSWAVLLTCTECGSSEIREVEGDLLDELVRAAQLTGLQVRMLVERRPEMREALERELTVARAHMGALERLGTSR